MASSDLIRGLFGEDSDDEINSQDNGAQLVEDSNNEENSQDNGAQNNSLSVPTENNVEEDTGVIEPGMVFSSVDSLFDAYQEHARVRVQSGGPENLGYLPKDCRNFIEERRRLRLSDGDAEVIHKMFATLQLKDRNLYHLMNIDEDGRLRNVLWIHPISKAAYEDFHDIVSFDTTYLVNTLCHILLLISLK
ncbi:hypothetical protein ACS0TY_018042 [Phlomoides rotata]